MVSFFTRFKAYLIDLMIFIFVVGLVSSFIPKSDRLETISKDLSGLQSAYTKSEITLNEYTKKYEELVPLYDKENIATNICNLIFILGYFIIIPLYNEGQTVGKKLLNIKIKKEKGKLTIFDMIIRNFVTTSLLQLMLSTIFIYVLKSNIYPYAVGIVSLVQILLVIITGIMIIYRKDKKGVHDLITGTHLEEAR